MPEQPSTDPAVPAAAETPVTPAQTAFPSEPDVGYTPDGVPTFESVREKIETRFGTALGATELAAETPEGRSAAEQFEARQKAAAERLAEIRASMHPDDSGAAGTS